MFALLVEPAQRRSNGRSGPAEIAGVVKAMRRAGPVVAYSAGGEAGEVLVVRSDRTGGPAWRALAMAAAFD
ncbi:hypothetical protein LCGC14_2514950, partial [marine sediment metagenome]